MSILSLKAFLCLTTDCSVNSKFFHKLRRPFVFGINLPFQPHPSLILTPSNMDLFHPVQVPYLPLTAHREMPHPEFLFTLTTDSRACMDPAQR